MARSDRPTQLLDLVPEDWIIDGANARSLDKARRTRLPQGVRVDSFGTVTDDGVTAAFFETLAFLPDVQDQL